MDDDGDYFTWTLDETKAVLSEDEAAVATLFYDIQTVGDMHHNPAKNVLYVKSSVEEIARRLKIDQLKVSDLLANAQKKMYAARLERPTPYVDKTIYAAWNAMCVSAYLEAAKALGVDEVKHFALRSLDRQLAEGLVSTQASDASGKHALPILKHVIAYSDHEAQAPVPHVQGVLDDYAFTVIASLDAYEATADLSYFRFARSIADSMVAGFYDSESGGFFDTRGALDGKGADEKAALGILGTRRKPFQDSPTPAGNSAAAIALIRLHAYTNDGSALHEDSKETSYLTKAKQTLEVYAAVAGQHGIFAATYGLAVSRYMQPPSQVVIIGKDKVAAELYRAAVRSLTLGTAILQLDADKIVSQNLPPALANTIPNLPALGGGSSRGEPQSFAVLCSNFVCQPPIFEAEDLAAALGSRTRSAA
jgi:hypothetical protein